MRVSPFEAARRVVAPYGRHGPQRAGDPLWPPVPCCRTFSLLPRRGGPLWPPVPAPWERPRPAHPRSRTLCHGWSKRGAAVKWHRPKFCAAPGPSGPGGIIPGTIFCAPEILHEGIGVSPVNGGPGENELEPEGTCFRRRCESPPAILWFLSHRWERNSPRRAKPCETARRVVAPYGRHSPRTAGGSGDPPLRRTTGISETWREGQAPPLRMEGETFCDRGQAGGHMGPPLRRHLRQDTAERGGAPKKPTKTTATFPGTLQQYFTKTRLCNNYDAILRFCYTSPKPVDGGPALEYRMSTGKGSYALTGWIFSDGSGLILAFRK